MKACAHGLPSLTSDPSPGGSAEPNRALRGDGMRTAGPLAAVTERRNSSNINHFEPSEHVDVDRR